ncbi:MAG: PDZ domain-containing protein [Lachnospiraceae bacterium]|nr:PDZ domain-containing protein [Lachnospiraceae bacterium]
MLEENKLEENVIQEDVQPVPETIMQEEPQPVQEPVVQKKPKKERKLLKSALGGLVFGLCAGVVFLGIAFIGQKTFLKDKDDREVVLETTATVDENEVSAMDEPEAAPSNTIAQITQNCMPSVVAITTKNIDEIRSFFGMQQYESEGAGSGIIVGKNDTELLVATNNHVVTGAKEVSVCFNDSEDAVVTAQVKGSDASKDLAIVAIPIDDISDEILSTIKVAVIGDSSKVQVGDQVVAIGNALGFGQSVTTGIISALDREVEIDDLDVKLFQTDAAINPGNSGGALLNMKGELIGINSAKFASELVEGMGYAIPISTAQPILDNLMNRETRELAGDEAGFLGVSVQDVSEDATEHYGIPKGAYVESTEEGGGAANAGIKQGDIITKFDGISITGATDLSGMIAYYKKGEQVEVTYMRSDNGVYQENTVTVTLTDSKQAKESKKEADRETEEDRGGQEIPEEEYPGEQYPGEGYEMPDMDEMEEFFRYFFEN